MKATATAALLLPVLIFSMSVKTTTAQTSQGAEHKLDAVHTLTESQKQMMKRIQNESEKRAAPIALKFAGIVRKIYENMLADLPDEAVLAKLSTEMKEATWELLTIKGQAIRETVAILTPQQKQLIRSEMRKPGAPADLSEVIAHTFKLSVK